MDACKQLLLSWTDLLFHILEHRHRGVQNISAQLKHRTDWHLAAQTAQSI
jgi:hypothetical protein